MRAIGILAGAVAATACGRLGFAPDAAAETTVVVSAAEVATCDQATVTLTVRDVEGEPVAGVAARLALSLAGGTGTGTFSEVVDHDDGTYTSQLTATAAGSAVTVVATLDGATATATAPLAIRAFAFSELGLRFVADAARSGRGCAPPDADRWSESVAEVEGTLIGFASAGCSAGTSGWCGTGLEGDPWRLALDGIDDHVDFGAELATPTFTLAVWFRRRGTGTITTTGTGGIDLEPLVSKGAADVEELDKDTNYVLGITTTATVGTDFERDPDSLNQPLVGTRAVMNDRWHHVAVSYDGAVRRLYVDGTLDAEEPLASVPANASLSRLCLGAACRTGQGPRGSWGGDVAIVAIYDRGLTAAELSELCRAHAPRLPGATCN